MDTSPILLLALALAARGWFVFPCKPDKTPLTPHGMKDATTYAGQIRYWFTRWPNALIGINCEMSSIFAVDIDDRGAWDALLEECGITEGFLVGPAQRTRRGGLHLIFRLPVGIHVPNTSGRLAPGVDLRSRGYICTGEGYTWLEGHSYDAKLTDAPEWLLNRIDALNFRKEQRDQWEPCIKCNGLSGYFLEKAVREARAGNRNQCGFELALQLRDSQLSESEARSYMLEYASRVPRGKHPYTDDEALASLRAAYSRPARAPVSPGYGRSINGK